MEKIKASELRLGNIIYNTKGQIDVVNIEALMYILKNQDIHQAEPIDLTLAWLSKLGWNKWKDNIYRISWGQGGIEFINITPNLELYFELGRGSSRHIQYVHQLQNLFFAVTGFELKAN